MEKEPGRLALIAALAAVYVIWGSTYLGIRFAIETMPPLLMAGSRFAIAGAVLFAFDRFRGRPWPTRREWIGAAVTGALLLGIGNGGVTWAEQSVPSSVAALIASTVPLWMTLLDWGRPGGVRPSGATLAGVVVGMIGLFILIGPLADAGSASASGIGVVILLTAALGWASGSVLAAHVTLPRSPITTTSAQMVTGGVILLVAGLLAGEAGRVDPVSFSARSLVAWVYLVVFGSWVGFSAYVWLLRATTPAKASTYAFVNPVVAVLLGAWLAAESVNGRMLVAMAVIVVAVALIVLSRGGRSDGRGETGRSAHRRSERADSAPEPGVGSAHAFRWSVGGRASKGEIASPAHRSVTQLKRVTQRDDMHGGHSE